MAGEVIGVLCSGRGTNLQSIIDAAASGQIKAPIGVVITDKPGVMALERAEKAGIPAVCIDRKQYGSREEFDGALLAELKKYGVTLVCLAGFMRLLTAGFIRAYEGRILNIHPALLPSFKGAHAHRDVLAYGAKVSGCTIHFVVEDMDAGPIILQAAVPVMEGDDEDSLGARVLVEEHKLYPRAIELFLEGKLTIDGRCVRISE